MVTQIEAAARGSYPRRAGTGHAPDRPVALAVALVFALDQRRWPLVAASAAKEARPG